MKRIIFTLLALVGTMSMNAQVTPALKVMKNGEVIAKYTADQADEFVFVEELATTGTAKATIKGQEVDVNWVQLWENGPKFAEFNVYASLEARWFEYYAWGGKVNKIKKLDYNKGQSNLTGDDDTATFLWGSNWRMPTKDELDKLLANCTAEWTAVGGVSGRKFTGKGDYKDNSVFLPATGSCDDGSVYQQGTDGFYWSSTANGSNAWYLCFHMEEDPHVNSGWIDCSAYSVRAVLNEKK